MHRHHIHCDVAEVVVDMGKSKLLADKSQQRTPVANVNEFEILVLGIACGC